MNKKEIREEMKYCSKRIHELQHKICAETDTTVALGMIEEMIAIADRLSYLDSMHKSILQEEFKESVDKLMKQFVKD